MVHPESLQYTYRLRKAKNFGTNFRYPQRGVRLVLSDPDDCCSALYNAGAISGAVALANRGSCSLVSKAVRAAEAGGVGVIVMDADASIDTAYIEMITDGTGRNPLIPAYFLLGRHGDGPAGRLSAL